MDADDPRFSRHRLPIHVLVAVDQEPRPGPLEIGFQGFEAEMDAVVPVMNPARGIVRKEDIHLRETGHQEIDLVLVVEKVPDGLVPPGPAQSSEAEPSAFADLEMEIDDRMREFFKRIVISLDREHVRISMGPGRLQNDGVRDIAAGKDGVGASGAVLPAKVVDIRENQEPHDFSIGPSGAPIQSVGLTAPAGGRYSGPGAAAAKPPSRSTEDL